MIRILHLKDMALHILTQPYTGENLSGKWFVLINDSIYDRYLTEDSAIACAEDLQRYFS